MSEPNPNRLIEYPFPIRAGQIAYIKIPLNISNQEMESLFKYMLTLILPQECENIKNREKDKEVASV